MTHNHLIETELMKKLGIESWRNLSKDKFLSFVSELPNLDKEVALKIIGQFPEFTTLVRSALSETREVTTEVLSTNLASQNAVYEAQKQYRDILERELNRENLTTEDRFRILELLKQSVSDAESFDRENKSFLTDVLYTAGMVAISMVTCACLVLGVGMKGRRI